MEVHRPPPYRTSTTFRKRKQESERILVKFEDKVPLLVEPASEKDPPIRHRKYVVPRSVTFGNLIYMLNEKMKMGDGETLLLTLEEDRSIPRVASQVGELYDAKRNPDGFLYVKYRLENTLG